MSDNIKIFFSRRLKELDAIIKQRTGVIFDEHGCDIDWEDFVAFVVEDVDSEFEWFFGEKINSDDIDIVTGLINFYIRKYKIKELSSFYSENCSD